VSKLQVRLLSPWRKFAETSTAVFSADTPADKADALLCEWAPSDELFTFPRRKAWYCCEPACQFDAIDGGRWPALRTRLAPGEFLYHGHPDARFRVPHITHFEPLTMNDRRNRQHRAVAIVSNHGGRPWRRHPQIAYRNRLITLPDVDLFGRSGWKHYQARWWNRPRPPANYCGELPGDWPAGAKRDLVAGYKVNVCLENMLEPHYFTEKLVEAVVAGCIPVYRAHPSLRSEVLAGAFWVDPDDLPGNPPAAIERALSLSLEQAQQANRRWLAENPLLAATSASAVLERLGDVLANTPAR
jgi:hypothetical protein